MAFPSVASITETSFSSAATSHLVAMPATVDAGDLLLMLFACRSNPTITTPTGWTELFDITSGHSFACFIKDAVGDEDGTTVDVVTSNSRQGAAQVYRITASTWNGTVPDDVEDVGTPATGTSANPDPPSLTPSWGAEDTLWLAVAGAGDDDETATAYPTNYTNGTDTIAGGGTNAAAQVYSARRELNATSDNPGTFTLTDTEVWIAETIAIRPAAAAAARRVHRPMFLNWLWPLLPVGWVIKRRMWLERLRSKNRD